MSNQEIQQQIKSNLKPLFVAYDGNPTDLGTLILETVINLEVEMVREQNYSNAMHLCSQRGS
jgi:hypothetical protein